MLKARGREFANRARLYKIEREKAEAKEAAEARLLEELEEKKRRVRPSTAFDPSTVVKHCTTKQVD
jgi:hypothetical protein